MDKTTDKVIEQKTLIAGRDHPLHYREFVNHFSDDNYCTAYLEQLRWPNGFICPSCRITSEPWRQTRGHLVCQKCRHQTSVTSGILLDKTRTSLTTWFEIVWHMATAKMVFQPGLLSVQ